MSVASRSALRKLVSSRVIFYVAQWFPIELRARSIFPILYCVAAGVAVVMGVPAGALMGLDGHLGLTGWQWLFAVEGFPAVILGVIFFALLRRSLDGSVADRT